MYLSDIQRGIQSAHCVTDMIYKYQVGTIKSHIIYNWAKNHKTMILLNGGNQQSLDELYNFMSSPANSYPFGLFREDEQSLNGCLTCVSIVIPERIYYHASVLRDPRSQITRINNKCKIVDVDLVSYDEEFTDWEVEFMMKLNQYRLA